MPQTAVIIMVKAPIAGTVKTRLTPFLSSEKAAELAACFAQDAARKAKTFTENVIISFAPRGGKEILSKLLPENFLWHEQRGADLGEKMHSALEFAQQKGFSPLIVIGTDSPNLPINFFQITAQFLQKKETDVVLAPTEDGGFCLIGLSEPNFEIFRGVEWSSAKTFEQTTRNIERLNLRQKALDLWFDVDFSADLLRLKNDLSKNPKIAPHTARFLSEAGALNKSEM